MKTILTLALEDKTCQYFNFITNGYQVMNVIFENNMARLRVMVNQTNDAISLKLGIYILKDRDNIPLDLIFINSFTVDQKLYHAFHKVQDSPSEKYRKYLESSSASPFLPVDNSTMKIRENIKIDGVELVAGETLVFKEFDEINKAANVGINALIEEGQLHGGFETQPDGSTHFEESCITPANKRNILIEIMSYHNSRAINFKALSEINESFVYKNEQNIHESFVHCLGSILKEIH